MSQKPGTLYLVGTPIGNLEDVTLRALRVLSEVSLVAAEDTRVTRVVLARHGIEARLVSYHAHSPPGRLAEIVARLRGGESVALVSDAGMPGISDPGARLVAACAQAGIPTAVVPGPTAPEAALSVAGIASKGFMFLGFLPSRSAARRAELERVRALPNALVCFEAPHRLGECLADLREALGDRWAACARELTKRFEEVVRGRLSELEAHFASREPRGEFTLVVAGAEAARAGPDLEGAAAEARELMAGGMSASRAVAHVARWRRVPRRELYQAVAGGRAEGA